MTVVNNEHDTNIPGCLTCHVPMTDIIKMHDLSMEALKPKVTFTGDMKEMSQEASNIALRNLQTIEEMLRKISNI